MLDMQIVFMFMFMTKTNVNIPAYTPFVYFWSLLVLIKGNVNATAYNDMWIVCLQLSANSLEKALSFFSMTEEVVLCDVQQSHIL